MADLDNDGILSEPTPLDLALNWRLVPRDPLDLAAPALPDMGAYEFFRDCNDNGIPDVCDTDCGPPGGPCDRTGCGQSPDCNRNGVPDECEPDSDGDGIPDVCEAIYGDFDFDGDVDQADFGFFQKCMTGPNIKQTDAICRMADLDFDGDVDQNDFNIFARCMTGPNIPYNPTCR